MARGTISKQRGKWRVRYDAGPHPDTGERRRQSRTFDTKKEAERFRAELIIADGSDEFEGRHFTLDQAIGNLYKTKAHSATYRYDLERAEQLIPAEYLAITIGRLRAADLVRLYDELAAGGRSPARVYRVHELIRSALGVAMRYEWIGRNVADQAAPPKHKRKTPTPPTPEQVAKVIELADDDLRLWLRLASTTGMRRGEVAGLRWSDVALGEEGGTLHVRRAISYAPGAGIVVGETKTGEERRIAIGRNICAELEEAQLAQRARCEVAGDDWTLDRYVIGTDYAGRDPWRPDRVTNAVRNITKKHPDLNGVRLKELRHYVATNALIAGNDVRTVAGRLGHAQTSTTTDIYAAFVDDADRGIADLFD